MNKTELPKTPKHQKPIIALKSFQFLLTSCLPTNFSSSRLELFMVFLKFLAAALLVAILLISKGTTSKDTPYLSRAL